MVASERKLGNEAGQFDLPLYARKLPVAIFGIFACEGRAEATEDCDSPVKVFTDRSVTAMEA